MDRPTTSWTHDVDGDLDGANHRPGGPAAPAHGNEVGHAPNPPRRRSLPRRPEPAPTSCIDCTGADAIAELFETVLSLEPLDLPIVGDGTLHRLWIGVTIDCATGAVLDAHLDLHS